MFTLFSQKKAPHQPACMVLHVVLAIFVALAVVAALVGMVLAHWNPMDGAVVFGTTGGSLSIIAFVLSTVVLFKQCKACMMPCDVCAVMTTSSKKK